MITLKKQTGNVYVRLDMIAAVKVHDSQPRYGTIHIYLIGGQTIEVYDNALNRKALHAAIPEKPTDIAGHNSESELTEAIRTHLPGARLGGFIPVTQAADGIRLLAGIAKAAWPYRGNGEIGDRFLELWPDSTLKDPWLPHLED